MYLCARGNNCSSFYDFKLDIGIVPTKCCYFFIVFHVVCPPNSVAISWRSALIRDVVIISSSYFSTQVWYLISLIVIHIHVFLLTAAPKSDDNYTAVYTEAGTFAATVLVAVIIVLVTLR
jgi:hypothetical protein